LLSSHAEQPLIPSSEQRDDLLKGFAKALFRRDIDALYGVVTPDFLWSFHDGLSVTKSLVGREQILNHLDAQKDLFLLQRFEDVVYHHGPDMSFMTCRIDETLRATGEKRAQRGIELYRFRDGKLALKDVYRKPIAT
jgi:ketosteroid isomerase-like protein